MKIIQNSQTQWYNAVGNILSSYSEADSTADNSFKKMAIMAALEYDSIQWSRTLLDSLMIENANDTAFYQFADIALSLKEDSLSWFDLDSFQRLKIADWATSDFEININAQAVLSLINDTIFVRTPEPLPDSGYYRLQETAPAVQQQEEYAKRFKAYPNPFEGTFTIAYDLETETSGLTIEVFDITGKHQLQSILDNIKTGESTFNLPDCNGFYVLRIRTGKSILYQTKLICIRH